ncbi:hypothetical protein HMPREF1210_01703 [Paenisporosarcina sp. HGH0030]|nr:hypothetical protein HMPREF1210_01703 [Paenisporosarcina sp. HGH0030]
MAYVLAFPIGDETLLRIVFPLKTGEKFSLKKPTSYNQKLQWYKLNYRDQLMVNCADKFLVHDYIKTKGYKDILTPLYGVYDDSNDINFKELPEKFVLKTNNAMGTNIFVKDKNIIDEEKIKAQLNKWLRMVPLQVWFGREWAYKEIKPRIICEEYIDSYGEDLIDYKFHCFNGIPEIIQVSMEKEANHRINFYDSSWNYIKTKHIYPTKGDLLKKPEMLDDMIKIAKDLSKDFPHVRVDFYNIGARIIFGELTFYTSAGFGKFEPNDLNLQMGELFELPEKIRK